LPFNPRFAGSSPAEDDGFLRAIKSVARLPSEGKNLPHVKDPYSMKNILVGKTHRHFLSTDISSLVSPALLLGVSAGYCQIALVGESGMIRTPMGNAQ
jgi:hypothetical protein